MPTIILNGERRQCAGGATALVLIRDLGLEGRPVAVEVNGQVVPRARLETCMLAEGDRLEIVTLVGGG